MVYSNRISSSRSGQTINTRGFFFSIPSPINHLLQGAAHSPMRHFSSYPYINNDYLYVHVDLAWKFEHIFTKFLITPTRLYFISQLSITLFPCHFTYHIPKIPNSLHISPSIFTLRKLHFFPLTFVPMHNFL